MGNFNFKKMPSHLYKFVLPKPKTLEGLPEYARWTKEEVADFVEKIGFREYRPCFEDNNVSGRQLAYISASTLPKIGIHKFEDIKRITAAFRSLTTDEYPNYHVSISESKNSEMVETWSRKARSGPAAEAVRIGDVLEERHHKGTHKIPL